MTPAAPQTSSAGKALCKTFEVSDKLKFVGRFSWFGHRKAMSFFALVGERLLLMSAAIRTFPELPDF